MKHLISIIGKAPSELRFEEFLKRLRSERERVGKLLRKNREEKQKPKKKSTQPKNPLLNLARKKAEEKGLTVDEVLRDLERRLGKNER